MMKQTISCASLIKKIGITLVFLFRLSPLYAQLVVSELKCEYRRDPLGIEIQQPRLAWQLNSTRQHVMQTAYRILVADNLQSLDKNIGNVWDTRKVNSDASIQIRYSGLKLLPTQVYYWKVMVWDNHNQMSSWSAGAKWQMSLSGNWKGAKWIAYDRHSYCSGRFFYNSLALKP
ncbi:hypothetical protein [Pedobacter foliorum]|uniref:glycoside hydrolase family 78 protein n=1 Tax=Pedobacter foliorum TaxID=2739058 RepID=UPI001565636B|nr:hypothetical protein [Pedobacter foliorum]NRF37653.1 hypothetical protein [Pedobacter foliorum]